jgi:hypothetical protein
MSKFNEKKFRFAETFTNTNGKTSGSGFIGVSLGVIAGLAIIALMVGYFLEIPNTLEMMGKILELIFASALLLGVRKVAPRFGNGHTTEEEREYDNAPYLETPKPDDTNKG